MVQRKLDHYFQSPGPSEHSPSLPCGVSFLHLPYHLRHQIYLLVDLVRFCPISLNQEGPRVTRYLWNRDDLLLNYMCSYESRKFMGRHHEFTVRPGCHCPPLPVALLCTSRAISKEVLQILYSENSFTIGRSDMWGLKPLRNLTPSAFSWLRVLTVRLNDNECANGRPVYLNHFIGPPSQDPLPYQPRCWDHESHDQPLRNRGRQHVAVLQEWQAIVEKLTAHAQLESLRLDLICDTQDVETAYDVVDRLSPIHNLKTCSLRLSSKPSWEHTMLSRQTVLQLTSESPKAAPKGKRLTYHLPTEILTKILGYSELIAPFDLEWRPVSGLVPFDCCKKCTATLDSCTCSFYHGGFSQSCECWRLPMSIFLVCHRVHAIATEIFYSRNRFIILPEGGRLDEMRFCAMTLPPLDTFLQKLPPNAAPFLRSVGLVIPPFKPEMIMAQGRLFTKWKDMIRLLDTNCDVLELSISLFITRRQSLRNVTESMLRPYYKLLAEPLRSLRGLGGAFIYLSWPNPYAIPYMLQYSFELEREIMGPEYDSLARGKQSNPPRIWYDGESKDGPFFAPNGRRIGPANYGEDAYGSWKPPYIYA